MSTSSSTSSTEIAAAASGVGLDSGEALVAFTLGYQAACNNPGNKSNMLQDCTLTYFDIPARGDTGRLMLTLSGVAFKDERVPFSDWAQLKPRTPWGSLPYLQLSDGTVLGQSTAVNRFIAKRTGFYPEHNSLAAAKIDQLVEGIHDLLPTCMKVGKGLKGPELEAARQEACLNGSIATLSQNIDNAIAKYGGGTHAVGHALTLADIFVFVMTTTFVSGLYDGVPADHFDRYPNITKVRQTVARHEGVQKYYTAQASSESKAAKFFHQVVKDLAA